MKILSIIFIFTITTNGQFLKVDYELERHRTLGNDFSQEFKDKVKENDKKTEKYILTMPMEILFSKASLHQL
ncbi:hypothetical protein [Epilithonimonas tenax]|uniref:hypothetical protein n=1 Tax=Epilithonimonas tenax TaxID=191577 RepID=UPI0003FFFE68|nr:hypothetical protein [Epilithonimonas tenax]